MTSDRITADHLSRSAYVYVRQSTPAQLINNPESRRRQYGLKDRALALGWQNVIIIDDDLGRSGGGAAERHGFEHLLAAVCTRIAGAVLSTEESRLARNGREWHTLLEYCALVGCLIIDENNIYDPKEANDRLLLGVKGAFSELELSILRQRSREALRLKAARGELYGTLPIGYIQTAEDKLEIDPDERVRDAIHLAFDKFSEFGSIRQVALWLVNEGIKMPVAVYCRHGRIVEWRLPRYNTVYRLLTNPAYAGAYVFGRRGSHVRIEDGRKRITRGIFRPQEEWEVLIQDNHEGYISWDEFGRNQKIIRSNANMKGAMVKGSIRSGGGLLVGLLRCGHCGRKLKVQYSEQRGIARYMCNGAYVNNGRDKCVSFGNVRVDAAVSGEVLRVIAPLGIDAAVQAIADRDQVGTERLRHAELELEQARYDAARAQRQYDAVDPENRIVASTLERRWNERLGDVARLEGELNFAREHLPTALTEAERAEILSLGEELPRLWDHPAATVETRKRILRTVIEEIIVTTDSNRLRLVLHWKGGDHTALEVAKPLPGEHRWKTNATVEQLICDLARLLPDASIASVLNRLGMRTAKGHTWTQQRITAFRAHHKIAIYRDGERAERGEVNLDEAANRLGVSKMTVIRLIKDGLLPAKQSCVGAPYVIREVDLDLSTVRHAIDNGRAVSHDARQGSMDFQ